MCLRELIDGDNVQRAECAVAETPQVAGQGRRGRGRAEATASTTDIASVQLIGSLAVWVDIPTNRGIETSNMTAGRKVVVAPVDPTNPNDLVVVAVYT